MVTFINRIGNGRYFGGITNNCNIWCAVAQTGYQAGTGTLAQRTDHRSARNQNLFSGDCFTKNTFLCYGKSFAVGMYVYILVYFF